MFERRQFPSPITVPLMVEVLHTFVASDEKKPDEFRDELTHGGPHVSTTFEKRSLIGTRLRTARDLREADNAIDSQQPVTFTFTAESESVESETCSCVLNVFPSRLAPQRPAVYNRPAA